MRRIALISILLFNMLLFLAFDPSSTRAEIEDSALFMEAFNAFQKKDYLFSIEKLNQLNNLFPDSPLRDVSLLMIARSSQRAGEYDTAAITINKFINEFGTGTLAGSVDEELIALGKKKIAGEKLGMNRQLHAAAVKVRNDQLSIERAAAMKAEQERLAREKAERERIARERAEAERRERERLAAIKAARDAVKFAFEPHASSDTFEVGTIASLPFVFVNNSATVEEFFLEASVATGGDTSILGGEDGKKPVQRVTLKPREKFNGTLSFRMPADKVDGSRIGINVKAVSAKFSDISKSLDTMVVAAGPILRPVAKIQKPLVTQGEQLPYRVTLLNVGSQTAREVELRISLPKQLKLVDAGGNGCWTESEQVAACRINSLANGQMTERTLKVEVRSNAPEGQSAKASVEVLQTILQVKESFNAGGFTVRKK